MDHLRVDVEGASSGAAGTSPRTPSRENAVRMPHSAGMMASTESLPELATHATPTSNRLSFRLPLSPNGNATTRQLLPEEEPGNGQQKEKHHKGGGKGRGIMRNILLPVRVVGGAVAGIGKGIGSGAVSAGAAVGRTVSGSGSPDAARGRHSRNPSAASLISEHDWNASGGGARHRTPGAKGSTSDLSRVATDAALSVASNSRTQSPQPAVPSRRAAVGEMVTPATRLALDAVALSEDNQEQSNQGGAPRPEEKPHEKAVLDQLAEALRQQGFPNLAEDRRLLARFARTRNFDPVPTLPLLLEYGRWRASLSLDTLTWDDVRGEMAKKHTMRLPVLTGDVENGPTARDAEGHPVIYKIQCNWERHPKGSPADIDRIHGLVFESVCREMDRSPPGSADTFTVLLDLTSTNARFDIGSFQMLGKTLKLGFRGRLHRLYIYPVGRLERLAFAALKAVMGKGTPQKVVMIPPEDRAKLLAAFPGDVLPVHLGGKSLVLAGGKRRAAAAARAAGGGGGGGGGAGGSLSRGGTPAASQQSLGRPPSLPQLSSAVAGPRQPSTDVPSGPPSSSSARPDGPLTSDFKSSQSLASAAGAFDAAAAERRASNDAAGDSAGDADGALEDGELAPDGSGWLYYSPEWPLAWRPTESTREKLLKFGTNLIIAFVCVDYGFLRGVRAENRHQASGRRLLDAAPPAPVTLAAARAAGSRLPRLIRWPFAALRVLCSATAFVATPWRFLPVLGHWALGALSGEILSGSPKLPGLSLALSYFLGRAMSAANLEISADNLDGPSADRGRGQDTRGGQGGEGSGGGRRRRGISSLGHGFLLKAPLLVALRSGPVRPRLRTGSEADAATAGSSGGSTGAGVTQQSSGASPQVKRDKTAFPLPWAQKQQR